MHSEDSDSGKQSNKKKSGGHRSESKGDLVL